VSHEIASFADDVHDRAAIREPATAVYARRVKPGREAEYETLAHEMVEASKEFAGHLAATMLHEDGACTYTLLYSFTNRPSLQAWLDSPERRRLLGQADRLSEEHARVPALTGLETWFTLPNRATIKPPPRWKMWLVSLIAIYPLVRRLSSLDRSNDQDLAPARAVGGPPADAADVDDLCGDAGRHTRRATVALARHLG
jgi:antibiotic biosynthesis monooxygenase (ABM) superfamily enzyme